MYFTGITYITTVAQTKQHDKEMDTNAQTVAFIAALTHMYNTEDSHP